MTLRLPFRFAGAEIPLILVPATINGRGPHHLLVDTGNGEAEPILFRRAAESLGLTLHDDGMQPGVAAPVRMARTHLDRLDIGSVSLSSLDALVLDDLPLPALELAPDGILGYGFFRDYRLIIDYPNRTLELAATRTPDRDGVPIALGSPKPYVIVEVTVHDGPPRPFLLDTGASATTVSPALAAELGLAVTPIEAMGVGGTMTAGTGVVRRLAAAGVTTRDTEVAVIDLFDLVSEAAGRKVEGILGYPFFKSGRLEIDYPARTVALVPSASAPP